MNDAISDINLDGVPLNLKFFMMWKISYFLYFSLAQLNVNTPFCTGLLPTHVSFLKNLNISFKSLHSFSISKYQNGTLKSFIEFGGDKVVVLESKEYIINIKDVKIRYTVIL